MSHSTQDTDQKCMNNRRNSGYLFLFESAEDDIELNKFHSNKENQWYCLNTNRTAVLVSLQHQEPMENHMSFGKNHPNKGIH